MVIHVRVIDFHVSIFLILKKKKTIIQKYPKDTSV